MLQVLKKGLNLKGLTAYESQDIIVRIGFIGQRRGIDLFKIFAHELCPVLLPSLTTMGV